MDKSLSEVHSSVEIKEHSSFLKRLLTFSGPAFMVSVGYMDPGNWATDIAGGSKFGFALIWVILVANLMAIVFQTLSARLGIVTGRDLAQACRDYYPKPVNFVLWILCEIAIAATDLAEVLGSAIGLYLLFKIPLLVGVVITTLDVLLLMMLMNYGVRKMEALILVLVATIGVCFGLQMFIAQPNLAQVATGFIPSMPGGEALFIALGIIGATVMPHNLYLHSALVQSRKVKNTDAGKAEANKFNLIDSVVALNGAFFVNAAILVLAAVAFYQNGRTDVASIIDAHSLLAPLLGSSAAPIAFGIALLAAGQSSTITGTFAGQIVMEGFIGLKIRPWLRRLITRLIAIIPAVIAISAFGDHAVDGLLVLSQVILSLQLPFAIVPLIIFTSRKENMGKFATPLTVKIIAMIAASFIIGLNLKFTGELIVQYIGQPGLAGMLLTYLGIPVIIGIIGLFIYIIADPFLKHPRLLDKQREVTEHPEIGEGEGLSLFTKVGIALEGNKKRDQQLLNKSLTLLHNLKAEVYLIHIVETAAGRFLGNLTADSDAIVMKQYLENAAERIRSKEMKVMTIIGGGEPEDEISRIAEEQKLELIIAGSHGHQFINDLIFGSTIDEMRHKTRLPVLAIPIDAD